MINSDNRKSCLTDTETMKEDKEDSGNEVKVKTELVRHNGGRSSVTSPVTLNNTVVETVEFQFEGALLDLSGLGEYL